MPCMPIVKEISTCGFNPPQLLFTSPDHGTAFDIAGKDMANPLSMIEALKLAARLARGQGA